MGGWVISGAERPQKGAFQAFEKAREIHFQGDFATV